MKRRRESHLPKRIRGDHRRWMWIAKHGSIQAGYMVAMFDEARRAITRGLHRMRVSVPGYPERVAVGLTVEPHPTRDDT